MYLELIRFDKLIQLFLFTQSVFIQTGLRALSGGNAPSQIVLRSNASA